MTLFGIRNCDTVKKALRWLEEHHVEHQFHDFRRDGLSAAQVGTWLDQVGADTLINRRGTTWKQLSDGQKALADDTGKRQALIALLCEQPTLFKRPVLDDGQQLVVGFAPQHYAQLFDR